MTSSGRCRCDSYFWAFVVLPFPIFKNDWFRKRSMEARVKFAQGENGPLPSQICLVAQTLTDQPTSIPTSPFFSMFFHFFFFSQKYSTNSHTSCGLHIPPITHQTLVPTISNVSIEQHHVSYHSTISSDLITAATAIWTLPSAELSHCW